MKIAPTHFLMHSDGLRWELVSMRPHGPEDDVTVFEWVNENGDRVYTTYAAETDENITLLELLGDVICIAPELNIYARGANMWDTLQSLYTQNPEKVSGIFTADKFFYTVAPSVAGAELIAAHNSEQETGETITAKLLLQVTLRKEGIVSTLEVTTGPNAQTAEKPLDEDLHGKHAQKFFAAAAKVSPQTGSRKREQKSMADKLFAPYGNPAAHKPA